ncbi:MAG: hypothetical protein GWN14_25070 [candidate division Zixibacteria bacterium]|nr:hypothetical protein [Gammaproteobacteria bacterium]NIX59102.1 hypothetical protein [candidate division Zixibacteria bacterium]
MRKLNFKKYLAMIALWFIGIGATIGASIYLANHEGDEYDKYAIPYIQKAVAELSEWDPEKAKALMAEEVVAKIPEEKFSRAMSFFSQLGALQSMEEPSFNKAFIDQQTDIGKQTIVEYDVNTHYEHGDAEINLKLLQKGSDYEIYSFNFRSEKLTPQEEK